MILTTVSADVEDGCKVLGLAHEIVQFVGLFPQSGVVLQELGRNFILLPCLNRPGIKGGFTAGRRRYCDIRDLVQFMVWVGELGLLMEE